MADAAVKLTLKGGTDFGAPWATFEGSTWNAVEKLVKASPFAETLEHVELAINDGNKLGAVKATLGATEEAATQTPSASRPEPPVEAEGSADTAPAPASAAQITLAAKKSGKTEKELAGISADEAKALIKKGAAK